MDDGIPVRLHQLKGEDLEEAISAAVARIHNEKITIISQAYKTLLLNGEVFSNLEDRKRYFSTIFMEAMKNNDNPIAA